MELAQELAKEFAKAINANKQQTKKETIVYGTTVEDNGKMYVKIDGSEQLTPITTTTAVKDGQRVTVMIKNHTATVTGNLTAPSASVGDVNTLNNKISEFEIVMAHSVTTDELTALNAKINNIKVITADIEELEAVNAQIESLEAMFAKLEYVDATNIDAVNAEIEKLEAIFADVKDLSAEQLEAVNAEITSLKGYVADFTYVSAEKLEAVKAQIDSLEVGNLEATYAKITDLEALEADIEELDANKLTANQADLKYALITDLEAVEAAIENLDVSNLDAKYANIDFSNIGKAAMEYFYAESGLIKDVTVGDATITGELVGVTIRGDRLIGGTVIADKLVIQGEDGLYYKLNFDGGDFLEGEEVPTDSLHGSVITANSITAEKISVKDLVAFDATIGGFNITEDSIYSGVKESVDNTTRGVYLDNTGQAAIGDADNYVKYYKDTDGKYKLAISADEMVMSSSGKSVEDAISSIEQTATQIRSEVSEVSEEVATKKNVSYHYTVGTSGTVGYFLLATIVVKQKYANNPIRIVINQRGRQESTCYIQFANSNTTDPTLFQFGKTGNSAFYIYKSDTSTWQLYVTKSESYDNLTVVDYENAIPQKIEVTWGTTQVETLPTGFKQAYQMAGLYGVDSTSGGTSGSSALATSGALYSTNTALDSKITQTSSEIRAEVSTTYTTKTEFNNLEIGGRNLIINSSQYREDTPYTHTSSKTDGYVNLPISMYMPCTPGETYTFQYKTDGVFGPHKADGTGGGCVHALLYLQTAEEIGTTGFKSTVIIPSSSYYGKTGLCTHTYTIPTNYEYERIVFRVDIHSDGSTSYTVNFWDFKAEKGNKATDWTPAPEDVDSSISEAVSISEKNTESAIQIASNSVLLSVSESYYPKSDTDNMIKELQTSLEQTSTGFEMQFNQLEQNLQGVVNGTEAQFTEINKYIRFENGNILLGETGNELALRIENDRIAFIQNDSEVAYFTDRKLYITDGEFISSLTLGNFAFIPRASGNLSFKKIR